MNITINTERRTSKPTDVGYIRLNMSGVDMTIGSLASGLAYQGWTCAPATYTTQAQTNETFKSQQLFMLDFDNETKTKTKKTPDEGYITSEQVISKCQELAIKPAFAYNTFSSKPEHEKFRVAFTYPLEITDQQQRNIVQNQLMASFHGKIDKSAKDSARLFFGSNTGLIYRDFSATLNPVILESFAIDTTTQTDLAHAKKYNIENGEIFDSLLKEYVNKESKNSPDLDIHKDLTVKQVCPAYEHIINQTMDFHHDVKFRIGTNLNYMPRLRAGYIAAVQKTSNQNYKRQLKAARKYGPMLCSTECPFANSCPHNSIYRAIKNGGNRYIKLKDNTDYRPLEEVRQALGDLVLNISKAPDGKVHIIKAQCGIGKTHELRNLRDVTIAFDTHANKDKAAKLFDGVENLRITKRMPDLPNEEIREEIKLLYHLGLNKEADQLLVEHTGDKGRAYLTDRLVALTGTVLTTHSKLFYNSGDNDVIIYDEDPLANMIITESIEKIQLSIFADTLKNKSNPFYSFYNQFDKGEKEQNLITPVKEPTGDIHALYNLVKNYNKNRRATSNMYNLIRSKFFVAEKDFIKYIYKRDLPSSKTIVIQSATISKEFAELLFGDRLVWHDIAQVKYQGKVLQDVSHSFSEYSLTKAFRSDDTVYNYIKELQKSGYPTITLNKFKKKLNPNNANVPHFGAATGSNDLKGKDIIIAGTPRLSPATVKLIGKIFDADILEPGDATEIIVEYNNYRFPYQTYSNKTLRAIDTQHTSSQLEQAAGRSRVITENSTIRVYGHFPIEQAELAAL